MKYDVLSEEDLVMHALGRDPIKKEEQPKKPVEEPKTQKKSAP